MIVLFYHPALRNLSCRAPRIFSDYAAPRFSSVNTGIPKNTH